MKTLNEILAEVKKSNLPIEEKKIILVKAGLRKQDIATLEFSGFFNDEKPLTFGVEIECFNCRRSDILMNSDGTDFQFVWEGYNHYDRRGVYKFTTDCSINGNDPRECVTPILDNTTDGFKSLENCCKILNLSGAMVNRSCGLHVHVGLADMKQKGIVNIYKNYQKLEKLIDSFMAPSRRGNNNHYAKTIAGYNYDSCEDASQVYSLMRSDRYHKVNPAAMYAHNTIEFRQHQGTVDYQKIYMWVNFCCKLVTWSKENALTCEIRNINEVPFLNSEEKSFFAERISYFAQRGA